MERPYARPVTGWHTGVTVPAAAGADGAARRPATKWMIVRAGINAPNPHMDGVSIQNRNGMCAFILRLPEEHGNIKKSIKTAHPANG